MAQQIITHSDILSFAEQKVNLPQDKASQFREQVNTLRDKLENYLRDHPDFTLKKMMLSGSLAKGTALKSLNDIDVACYISGADTPREIKALLNYLAEKLRTAYPNFKPEQIVVQTYSITVKFMGSGLDVDIVPILYSGDPNWYGNLVSQDDGSFLETSIPLHLEFIRKRKKKNEKHFAQVARLIKYWARYIKGQREGFRFKSFMIELILAKLSDDGVNFSNYPEAMQAFFTYIIKSDIKEIIYFTDYYTKDSIPAYTDPVRIIDPVNSKNNASKLYTKSQAEAIVEEAMNAGDAIDSANATTTKERANYFWQKVFGPTFNV